jgi:superfamily II helicase
MTNKDEQMISKLNPPISKRCRLCKENKLLSEFDFSNRARDKHTAVCKNCVEKKFEGEGDEPYGACCQHHFEEMMINNTYNQLDMLLRVVEALQYGGGEIPTELLKKMHLISRKGGIRCSYDTCSCQKLL